MDENLNNLTVPFTPTDLVNLKFVLRDAAKGRQKRGKMFKLVTDNPAYLTLIRLSDVRKYLNPSHLPLIKSGANARVTFSQKRMDVTVDTISRLITYDINFDGRHLNLVLLSDKVNSKLITVL